MTVDDLQIRLHETITYQPITSQDAVMEIILQGVDRLRSDLGGAHCEIQRLREENRILREAVSSMVTPETGASIASFRDAGGSPCDILVIRREGHAPLHLTLPE